MVTGMLSSQMRLQEGFLTMLPLEIVTAENNSQLPRNAIVAVILYGKCVTLQVA
jgi:hypothetical protein